jgi:hypothetical protein
MYYRLIASGFRLTFLVIHSRRTLISWSVETCGRSTQLNSTVLRICDHGSGRLIKKNAICREYEFPILRINSKYLDAKYRRMTLLAWIMEVRELEIGFNEAQAKGQIAWDEGFDPLGIYAAGERRWPYWLSFEAIRKIQSYHRAGKVAHGGSSGFIGFDSQGVVRGIEAIALDATSGISVETAIRPQDFPVDLTTLLREILLIQVVERLDAFFADKAKCVALVDIDQRLAKYHRTCRLSVAHGWVGPAPPQIHVLSNLESSPFPSIPVGKENQR